MLYIMREMQSDQSDIMVIMKDEEKEPLGWGIHRDKNIALTCEINGYGLNGKRERTMTWYEVKGTRGMYNIHVMNL